MDQLTMPRGVDVWRGRATDAASGAARELSRRDRRAADDGRDLFEREIEHVMQHEGDPLRRREGIQHDQQGRSDGIGQHDIVFGGRGGEGLRRGPLERLLAP